MICQGHASPLSSIYVAPPALMVRLRYGQLTGQKAYDALRKVQMDCARPLPRFSMAPAGSDYRGLAELSRFGPTAVTQLNTVGFRKGAVQFCW
jgi:hypothetical protein